MRDTSKKDMFYLWINIIFLVLGIVFKNKAFSAIFYLFMWLSLAFYGIRFSSKSDTALTMANSTHIRGVSAIEIMLGHIGILTGNLFQFPNRKAGILFVGLFFMLSGYGLAYGYANKVDYLSGFLRKRLISIALPVVIVILVEAIVYKKMSFMMIVSGSARWYITELLVLYILFYCTYRLFKKKGVVVIAIVSTIFVVIAFSVGMDNPWYGSTLCFPLGMAYYGFRSSTKNYNLVKRGAYIFMLFVVVVVSIIGFFAYGDTLLGDVICRNVASTSFCMAIILILEIVSVENRFSLLLSGISYEIYLLHPLMIKLCSDIPYVKDYVFLYTITVTVVTLCGAWILHSLCSRLLSRFKFV